MERSLKCNMKTNLFPDSLTRSNWEAAVFPLLPMTCCNGDECSAYSNAIFWHRSCEKGHLLNTTRRKLMF